MSKLNQIVVFTAEPKKIVAVFNEPYLVDIFRKNPIMEVLETEIHWGYITDNAVGRFDYINTKDGRVLLLAKPDHLSLSEAYEYIIAHLNR